MGLNMNKLLVNCSILPLGGRGFLLPTGRKNPRFPAGSKFEIKKRMANAILVKFHSCNSIFGIMDSEAEEVLGMKLSDYLREVDKKKAEGMKLLSEVLIESGLMVLIQEEKIGVNNAS